MSTVPVVRHEITVEAPQQRAFDVFTAGIGEWFPAEYNLLASPIVQRTFEPRVGGQIIDRAEDGSECRWARVLVYDPPARVVFSWDISAEWQIEPDLANTSEVEVRFIAEGDRRTRVELEHRHLDRHGPAWPGVRDSVDGEGGWGGLLQRFAAHVAA